MENTPYADSIVAGRSVKAFEDNEQAALEGTTLLSAETEAGMGPESGVLTYINDNFAQFLRYLRALAPRDQEKLLSYYCLGKTQTQLARVFRTTQTVASFQIRASVRCMAAIISWGGRNPSVETMERILTGVGHGAVSGQSLAEVVAEYAKLRSFVEVARNRKIHRPHIRRAISNASKEMVKLDQPPEVQALGWWLFKLIDKSNPLGKGLRLRARAKEGDVEVALPDVCGKNRVSTDDPDLDALFQSKANF